MIDEGCFSRLLDLISGRDRNEDPALHRLLLDLMYEMSRIERLRYDDLLHVDDHFITYLFGLIEELSDDVHDPYHYPIIRVLVRYYYIQSEPFSFLSLFPLSLVESEI